MTITPPVVGPGRHRSPFSIGTAVMALAGVPAIWLSFAYHTSPASVLFDCGDGFFSGLWILGWPHLLAIPIAAALVRWVASGRLSSAERRGGRVLAAASGALTGSIYLGAPFHATGQSNPADWIAFLAPLAILICGAAICVRAVRTGRAQDGLDAILLMEVAYLTNIPLCLLAAGGWDARLEIGGYLALWTSAVYGLHLLSVIRPRLAPERNAARTTTLAPQQTPASRSMGMR